MTMAPADEKDVKVVAYNVPTSRLFSKTLI